MKVYFAPQSRAVQARFLNDVVGQHPAIRSILFLVAAVVVKICSSGSVAAIQY